MTKEEFIEKAIKNRKEDDELSMCCGVNCNNCPYAGPECYDTIAYDLLDYIIENESEYQETNLEHYFEDSSFTDGNAYIIKVRLPWNIQTDNLTTWLLSPYEEPKYKLTQFEYDLIKAHRNAHGKNAQMKFIYVDELRKLGYLKGVPKDAEVGEILENAEVIDENEIRGE